MITFSTIVGNPSFTVYFYKEKEDTYFDKKDFSFDVKTYSLSKKIKTNNSNSLLGYIVLEFTPLSTMSGSQMIVTISSNLEEADPALGALFILFIILLPYICFITCIILIIYCCCKRPSSVSSPVFYQNPNTLPLYPVNY